MTSVIIAAVVRHAVNIESRIPVVLITNYNISLPYNIRDL